MKRTLVRVLLMSCVLVLVLGCGGGGGSSTPSDQSPSTITYHLQEDGFYEPGHQVSFSLSGNSNQNDNVTGTYSIATRDYVDVDGIRAIHQETYVSMTANGRTISIIENAYLDAETLDPIYSEFDGVRAEPTSISQLPDTAEIGDFGALTSFSYSDGDTNSGTWILESAGNNLAIIVMNFTHRNNAGGIDYTEKVSLKIDESGYISSISFDIYYPDSSLRLILSGTRTS